MKSVSKIIYDHKLNMIRTTVTNEHFDNLFLNLVVYETWNKVDKEVVFYLFSPLFLILRS